MTFKRHFLTSRSTKVTKWMVNGEGAFFFSLQISTTVKPIVPNTALNSYTRVVVAKTIPSKVLKKIQNNSRVVIAIPTVLNGTQGWACLPRWPNRLGS